MFLASLCSHTPSPRIPTFYRSFTMKLVLLATIAACATAFQVPSTPPAPSALKESQSVGVTQPLGFFDPLGYISDQATFERYRAVERKHGRIAMMAMAGVIVHNNGWVFDGYLSPSNNLKFSDIGTGIGGLFQVPKAGLAQILVVCGLVEVSLFVASFQKAQPKSQKEKEVVICYFLNSI